MPPLQGISEEGTIFLKAEFTASLISEFNSFDPAGPMGVTAMAEKDRPQPQWAGRIRDARGRPVT